MNRLHSFGLILFTGALLVGCPDDSRRVPVGAAAAGSTSAVASAARAHDVRVASGSLARHDVAVAFRMLDPQAQAADATVTYSVDGGQSWNAATLAQPAAQLASGPAPGPEHVVTWTSAADVSSFVADVLVRVERVGGGGEISAPFALDNDVVSTHVTFNRRPFLQATGQHESLVLWRTDGATNTVVEYGVTPALGQVAGDPSASTVEHEVLLTGLRAGEPCYYRIVAGGQAITRRLSFRTAPAPTSDQFTFLVVGDSGMDNPVQHQVADLMAQEDAHLYLNTGDVVYPVGGIGAVVSEYNARFFEPYQELLQRMPAFPVVGNHDLYGLGGQPFKQTFVLPDNGQGSLLRELFYAFEWGDCKFIALETNFLHRSPLGPHIPWLRDELSNHSKKWVIVYMHTPLYSAGHHGDNRWLQNNLGPVLEHGGVDLVIAGHDHNYERTKPIKQFNNDPSYPGLVHIVTGGGGADLRPVNPNARTEVATSEHHYLKVRIDGDWLHGEAVNVQGQTIDAFSMANR